MRVSVVICTYNRAHSLGATLESLRSQNYEDFEVVVVNGPSTDDTESLLERWRDDVRVERCAAANLSVSRNIGIRAAAGDVVAFIDDDALPEFDWLAQAVPAFTDPEVGGVGGIVFDHTGLALQYRYSASDRFGEVVARQDRPFDDQCFPGSFQFPYLQGTNALFRRDALASIGGFDEIFDYYLDETDVCCRMMDAGFTLRQLADAPVHHKFLPSNVRDHERIVTNWYPIVKNQVYFSYRHALDPFTEAEIQQRSADFIDARVRNARWNEAEGRLPAGAGERAAMACAEAFARGIELGIERQGLRLGPVTWERPEFRRFETVDRSARRKISIVSSGYTPNVTGGIARFISDLAPALARRGHEVRVVTAAVDNPAIDLEDGVWVHRVDTPPAGAAGVAPEVFAHVNDFATAAVGELERIGQWSGHDVVYGPLWDVEVLGVLRRTGLPVAVQVATPLAIAAAMAGLVTDDASAAAIGALIALETEVLETADLFHANSDAVADTIGEHYGHVGTPARWSVVHLGLVDRPARPVRPVQGVVDAPEAPGPMVLFVGRFEARKGIDTFLAAVARIAADHRDVRFVAAGEDRPLSPGQPMFGAQWLDAHRHEAWFDQIRFEGVVDDDRLHELYESADLAVLPSRYESFGLVVVEAMLHGTAVISSDTSGIRDVVRNGVDGVLVAPGDVDDLERAMRALLDDPARRAELAAAGRRRFVEAFHIDAFAERFDRFLGRATLHDASAAVDPAGVDLRRGRCGGLEAVLGAGRALTFTRTEGAAATLAVEALEPATVIVDDGAARPAALEPGECHRFALAPGAASVRISVVSGSVAVAGLIEVVAAT